MDVHSLLDIDAKRNRLGISQKELCRQADVHESTYSKAKAEDREPMPRIRRKLWATLNAIAEERGLIVLPEGEIQHAAE